MTHKRLLFFLRGIPLFGIKGRQWAEAVWKLPNVCLHQAMVDIFGKMSEILLFCVLRWGALIPDAVVGSNCAK